MNKRNQLKNLCLDLSVKYNIPYDLIDKFSVFYFDIIKKIIYDGDIYTSAEFGRFYATPRKNRDLSKPFPPQRFFQNYKFCFKATGKWAYRAGHVKSELLHEYCSRVISGGPTHQRRWFDPESCRLIDMHNVPVPEKILRLRKEAEEKNNKG